MVFNCPIVRCIANYDCYDRGALFSLPEKEEQKKQWISFQIEKNISSIKRVNICYRHFADNLKKKVSKEQSFYIYEYKPVPTIIPVTREKENLPQMQFLKLLKLRKSHQDKRFYKKTR